MDVPLLKAYNHIRKDSESDMDDGGEAGNTNSYSTDNFTESIKHEFVPYDIPPDLPKMETLPSLLFEENSQSLSESTISTTDIFNMTDPNLCPSSNITFGAKEESKNFIGFYQITKSCTISPSDTQTNSNMNLNKSELTSTSKTINVDEAGKASIGNDILNTSNFLDEDKKVKEHVPAPRETSSLDNESIVTETTKLCLELEIPHGGSIETSTLQNTTDQIETTGIENQNNSHNQNDLCQPLSETKLLCETSSLGLQNILSESKDMTQEMNEAELQNETLQNSSSDFSELQLQLTPQNVVDLEVVNMEIGTINDNKDDFCENDTEVDQQSSNLSEMEICTEEEIHTSDTSYSQEQSIIETSEVSQQTCQKL